MFLQSFAINPLKCILQVHVNRFDYQEPLHKSWALSNLSSKKLILFQLVFKNEHKDNGNGQ